MELLQSFLLMSNSNVLSVKDYADSWLKMLKIQDQTFGIITSVPRANGEPEVQRIRDASFVILL